MISLNFPKALEDWNYDIIKDLVDKGYYETDMFDFKAELPKVDTLSRTVCAFANTNGGFLIFGVQDIKASSNNRIIGIAKNKDFIKEFQDKIKNIEPSVYFF